MPSMRPLAVVAMLLALSPVNWGQQEHPSSNKAEASESSPAPSPAPASHPVIVGQQNLCSPEKTPDSKTKPNDRAQWFWPPIWSNWALVLAAVWGGCIALRTLRTLTIQARANLKSARASKDAAKAMRESIAMQHSKERARLAIDFIPNAKHYLFDKDPSQLKDVPLRAVQYGPTRAFDVIGEGQILVTESRDPVNYSIQMQPARLPSVIDGAISEPKSHDFLIGFIAPKQEHLDAIQDEKMFVHLWGNATYTDVFGDPHKTTFRYIWRPKFTFMAHLEGGEPSWTKNGPDKDNQAT